MTEVIRTELYKRCKARVLAMSLAKQRYLGVKQIRRDSCLSDAEIAQKLGLNTEQVAEIRCRAEVEALDLKTLLEAEHWKKKKAAQILEPDR